MANITLVHRLWRTYLYTPAVERRTQRLRAWYRLMRRKYPRRVKAAWIVGGTGLAGLTTLLLLILLVYLGAFGALPSYGALKSIRNNTASEVFSADSVLLGKYYVDNRVNATMAEISPFVTQALLATEDTRFFEHSGIDFRAWMRVIVKSILLRDESSGGGSTLSQQLAKNLYPRQSHSVLSMPVNKIREMMIARRLEKLYTKEELLNLYLNTVPFSENVYGIKVAAQRFFNASPQFLKPEQAALLVGMLKGSTLYNPLRNPERAQARRNVVLSQMCKYEYLKMSECDSLQQLDLNLDFYREGSEKGSAAYFREHLRLELEKLLKNYRKPDGSSYDLLTDGLKIYTTIDSRLQRYAEEAVDEHMAELQKEFEEHWKDRKPWGDDKWLLEQTHNTRRYKSMKAAGYSDAAIDSSFRKPVTMTIFSWNGGQERKTITPLDSLQYYLLLLNAGFVAMDHANGQIKAWVGGIHHRFFQYDHVTSRRQAGSTFKPIVYTQALLQGLSPCDYFPNELITYPEYENWQPRNSDGQYGGLYSMAGGLSESVNTVAVGVIMETGINPVIQLAHNMGIEADIPKVPSIALGTAEVSLYDLIQAYGTLASRGVRPEPNFLTAVLTSTGDTIAVFRSNREKFQRVLPANTTAMITDMLETVIDSGTANRLRYQYGLGGGIAGKTGTTQNQSDGWFIGYTPRLVAGAWVGAEWPQIHFRSLRQGQGAHMALPIWGKFFQKAYKDPAFQRWQRYSFPPLPDSVRWEMECPPYIEDDQPPEWELVTEDGPIRQILDIFRDKGGEDPGPTAEDQSPSGRIPSEQAEEIRKRNEKLERKRERQRKRKDFLDKVLKKEEQ